ncbi:hypothetical protein [Aminobacter sp. BE322]
MNMDIKEIDGAFAAVPVMDGINHPSDHAGGPRIAGTLRFVASPRE